MRVILSPFGSHGDVHPFLGLALALRRRGHDVRFIVNSQFHPLVRSLGFEPVGLGDDEQFERVIHDPDLWHPRKAFFVVARVLNEGIRRIYNRIEELYVPGETVAMGGTISLGVRVAHDKLGVPAGVVHLQPGVIHSDVKPPAYPRLVVPTWWPLPLRKAFFRLLHRRMLDPVLGRPLNGFRAELGLPPVDMIMRDYLHSPLLNVGFFPRWFAEPQADWPKNVHLVGFPLFDEREVAPIDAGLDDFLKDGDPPIAFTPGSANVHGAAFFRASVEACGRLGRRGLLLTRHADQVPKDLPDSVRHVDFAPFGLLLPRCAALVHHGGIGTAAQGMAAGIPQLVMHLAHDQYDNAARMKRLGIARGIEPSKYKGPRVEKDLRALLDSCEVDRCCKEVAARFPEDADATDRAAALVERLGENRAQK